jgi:hypothetical protein
LPKLRYALPHEFGGVRLCLDMGNVPCYAYCDALICRKKHAPKRLSITETTKSVGAMYLVQKIERQIEDQGGSLSFSRCG